MSKEIQSTKVKRVLVAQKGPEPPVHSTILVKVFHNMAALTGEYLRITTSRDYIASDSLSNDPWSKKC